MAEEKKYKYKQIHIDEATYNRIKEIAKKTKSKNTTVIRQSIDIYYNMVVKPIRKSSIPDINKVAWYIFKLSQSVGELKVECSEENYNYLIKNLEDFEKRLGIDTRYFADVVDKFYKNECKKNSSTYIEINDNAKLIITSLLEKLMKSEDEK